MASTHKFLEDDTIHDGFNIRQLPYFTGSMIILILTTRVIVRPYGLSVGSRQGPTTDTSVYIIQRQQGRAEEDPL